ncbi:MAP kinase-activating death domain protein [Eumeta japonica]|uniref:MAP kinase-activating death domain protein n=1 Tax=Eumeta variegata TaxID=151549 RepID=A0A4C1XJC3_EUMVA|nr:MAP kinase-activating death domain protein [Eumeta japonica]
MSSLCFQADQICYAVLCVFSYFAAGQEQKKQILEQAAKVPPVSAEKPDETPPVVASSKLASPGDVHAAPTKSTTEPIRKKSPIKTEVYSRVGEAKGMFTKEEPATPTQIQAGSGSGSSRSPAERAESLPARVGLERSRSELTRGESLGGPPRRPPPPSPAAAAAAKQRLVRAQSQAVPPRPVDPPLIPPRAGMAASSSSVASAGSCGANARPAGPPPALPPRQSTVAADVSSTPRPQMQRSMGQSPTRRPPPATRQGSVSGPFTATNPFTAPRHAEFVIPQRTTTRRPSTPNTH